MEEKKTELANYLRTKVSPFITPLMEQMAKTKPDDLAEFTKKYVEDLICNYLVTIEKRTNTVFSE